MTVPTFKTRREFLGSTLLGGSLAWTIPAFVQQTIGTLQAGAAESATQAVTGKDSPILVIVQLAGGNDGLNTVVPYTNDYYRNARPTLGIPAKDVLALSGELGLHPSLAGLKSLWDDGTLAIVNGVGYPNPNRSHFRSTEIWETASDSNRFEKHGWLGRYFDNACAGCDPTVAVNIGGRSPQAFDAKTPKGVSFQNPQSYRYIADADGNGSSTESYFREVVGMEDDDASPGPSGGSIGRIMGGGGNPDVNPVDFLERTSLDAQLSSDRILAITKRVKAPAGYPASALGNELRLVSTLIQGGLGSRVYYASQGGFDTHTNQAPSQQRLLRDFGDAVRVFLTDMKNQGLLDRVTVLVFSEFGRRVAQNASGGTDHGAAAPLFVAGGRVKGGVLGAYPSLAPKDLHDGDLKFSIDFRSVYATLLEDWLGTASVPILGRKFPKLRLLA
jgi:uncharacterized protein (DUF1501 family)